MRIFFLINLNIIILTNFVVGQDSKLNKFSISVDFINENHHAKTLDTNNEDIPHTNERTSYGTSHKRPAPPDGTITPPLTTVTLKDCESILEEKIKEGWKRYDTQVRGEDGYIKNDSLNNLLTGSLRNCLLGKEQAYIQKLFGPPSKSTEKILIYLCYKEGTTDPLDGICLIFYFLEPRSQMVTDVKLDKCVGKI